jgi:hypothetical protein
LPLSSQGAFHRPISLSSHTNQVTAIITTVPYPSRAITQSSLCYSVVINIPKSSTTTESFDNREYISINYRPPLLFGSNLSEFFPSPTTQTPQDIRDQPPWHPSLAMAPMKHNNNNHSSSSYGEDAAFRQASILASAYVVDPSATSLKGLHYCTTGAAGAEWYS